MTAVAAAEPGPRPGPRPVTAAQLVVRDPVWVWAYGKWRPGQVTQLAVVRVRVRYQAGAQTRERWFAASADEPIYHGRGPAPEHCGCGPGCASTPAPSADADQVWIATARRGIAAHAVDPQPPLAAGQPAQRWTACGRVVEHSGRRYGLVLTVADAIARYAVTWCRNRACFPNGRP